MRRVGKIGASLFLLVLAEGVVTTAAGVGVLPRRVPVVVPSSEQDRRLLPERERQTASGQRIEKVGLPLRKVVGILDDVSSVKDEVRSRTSREGR